MILLVTNQRDITSDFVVAELSRRGVPFFRFNTDQAAETDLRFELNQSGGRWLLALNGESKEAGHFRAGYFRRPALPDAIEIVAEEYREHVRGEWAAALNSFYAALSCNWLSRPSAIVAAEDKPRQLMAAHRLGFRVPETLMASRFCRVSQFVSDSPSIAKPLRSGRLTAVEQERIAFTSRVAPLAPSDKDAVESSPVIYQREIGKACDLRVTVVGTQVFACEIHQTDLAELDWRKADVQHLEYRSVELPDSEVTRCVSLVRQLELGFGAIDLVRDRVGQLWFLEINPNGQWAWIEHRAKLPIASAVVDLLIERAAP